MRLQPLVRFGAAGIQVAPEVDITVLYYEVELQGSHGKDVVVKRCINMPRLEEALSMGMKKGDNGRKRGVVVFDYVCQIGHGLVPLVDRRGELVEGGIERIGRIDDVDSALPTAMPRSD
jgi:hypothetical protein